MLQKIRLFLRYTLSWIVVIGCVWLIGYILYPLFIEKYNSMALRQYENASGEVTIRIPSGEQTQIDRIADRASQAVSSQTTGFFSVFREVFSTNANKKTVLYQKDDATGIYRAQ